MKDKLSSALRAVEKSLFDIDEATIERACEMIAASRTIGIYGCGREGYQMRGFSMRLFHLGLDCCYLGDINMPPLGPGDLLIVSAGPGELATVSAHMATARKSGARVVFLTAVSAAGAAARADQVLTIPAQTMAGDENADPDSILPMGSVYEGALFFLFELMVADLKVRLGETADTMRARHTNME